MKGESAKPPKPEDGLPPCPNCKSELRYTLGPHYIRCLNCGKTFRDVV